MITHDQPTIFGDKIVVALSSIENGSMSFKGYDEEVIRDNREAFFDQAGIDPLSATLVQVTYEDTTNFTRYKIVEDNQAGEGILEPLSGTEADALVVTRPEQALFLPLADCVGAVIFDPINMILMVTHLGRQSVEQNGGQKSIQYIVSEFGSDPDDLLVWLSPAAGKENYPLRTIAGKGLHEAVVEQMISAGLNPSNCEISHVDTTENPDYYSHSEFLKGEQPDDGRFAIIAMMVE